MEDVFGREAEAAELREELKKICIQGRGGKKYVGVLGAEEDCGKAKGES